MPQQFPFASTFAPAGPPPGMMSQQMPRPPRLMDAGPAQTGSAGPPMGQPMMSAPIMPMAAPGQDYFVQGPMYSNSPPAQMMPSAPMMFQGNNASFAYDMAMSSMQGAPIDPNDLPPGEQVSLPDSGTTEI